MFNILKIFLLYCFFPILSSLFLTYSQWANIQFILQQKTTTKPMKNKINYILFNAYKNFAINQAYQFKKYHKQKCFNINIEDLIISSQMGLYQSIKNYKGNSNFENYSSKYIQGELYNCLTNFHEINNIPKGIRRKKKTNFTREERRKYNKALKTSFVSQSDEWRFDKINLKSNNKLLEREKYNSESYKLHEVWSKIKKYFENNSFGQKNKRIFLLKYNYEFMVKRSNNQISQLIGCSEENIRQILIKMKMDMYPLLFKNESITFHLLE